jgi:hypothetical protein
MSQSIKTKAGDILPVRCYTDDEVGVSTDGREFCSTLFDNFKLPEGKWVKLGPISHKGEFNEELAAFVKELIRNDKDIPFKERGACLSYFIKMIEAQGEILWSNPMGKPEVGRDKKYSSHDTSGKSIAYHEAWHARLKLWKQYEDLVIKEDEIAVVLLKPNK